jgi:hypothetical protein
VSSLLADYSDWPSLAQVFKLERQVTQRGKTTTEVMYGMTSQPPEVASPHQYANMAAGRRELDAIINRALFQQSLAG